MYCWFGEEVGRSLLSTLSAKRFLFFWTCTLKEPCLDTKALRWDSDNRLCFLRSPVFPTSLDYITWMTDEEKSATFGQQGTLHTAQPQLSVESGSEED